MAVKTAGRSRTSRCATGSIRAGDKAISVEASDSQFERLTVDGHVLALGITGDGNDLERITAHSSLRTLDIKGDRVEFERNTITVVRNETMGDIDGDRNEIERSSFSKCGSSGPSVYGDRVDIERNTLRRLPADRRRHRAPRSSATT